MSIFVRIGGTWRTVSQPAIKVAGAWRNATAVAQRVGWPNRYASKVISPDFLTNANRWTAYWSTNFGYDSTHPTATIEAGKVRLTWTTDAGKLGWRGGNSFTVPAGRARTFSITCTEAPAGVPWEISVGENPFAVNSDVRGNTVIGPGTSTVTFTPVNGNIYVGIRTTEAANGTTGHLVSAFTDSISDQPALSHVAGLCTPWKQTWPHPNTGPLAIYGVRKEAVWESYGYYYTEKLQYTPWTEAHYLNNVFNIPRVPFYRIKGDTSAVASAKVTLRFTPKAPKSPVEHTISWDAPVGWGLYHIGYMAPNGYGKFYIAALTDAEAATVRADPTRFITTMWTPREGGWFCWSPVCWDISGVTVPMRGPDTGADDIATDVHSGYAPFPPNVSATSLIADYSVSSGYTDMYDLSIVYTAITIELKNSGGGVLASWTGSLAAGHTSDVPGKGRSVEPQRARTTRELQDYSWPQEWRGIFDNYQEMSGSRNKVVFSKDLHDGSAEWIVLDPDGNKIGDFRLGILRDNINTIEIKGVNLEPSLLGMGIMRSIVHHGTVWCPTRYVFIRPPDEVTYEVMRSWGWTRFEDWQDRFTTYSFYETYEYWKSDTHLIYDTHVPMYNRFQELGLPGPEDLVW